MNFYQIDIKPNTNKVIFSYKEREGDRQNVRFALTSFQEDEPKIISICKLEDSSRLYLYTRKDTIIGEIIDIHDNTTLRYLDQDQINYYVKLVERVVLDKEFDYLNEPPSVEEQVEDFIKKFFNDSDEEEDLKQKDFLADFFAELEDDDTNSTTNN